MRGHDESALSHVSGAFWAEVVGLAVSLGLGIGTWVRPRWIELAFHVDPDHGSGAVEWAIVAAALLLSAVTLVLVGRGWAGARRQARTSQPA